MAALGESWGELLVLERIPFQGCERSLNCAVGRNALIVRFAPFANAVFDFYALLLSLQNILPQGSDSCARSRLFGAASLFAPFGVGRFLVIKRLGWSNLPRRRDFRPNIGTLPFFDVASENHEGIPDRGFSKPDCPVCTNLSL
jgi:hypothetical protein